MATEGKGPSGFKQWWDKVDWDNTLSNGLSALSGAAGIFGNMQAGRRVNLDNYGFNTDLAGLQAMGTRDYGSIDQVVGDSAYFQYTPQRRYEDVRGLSEGQQWGLVGSSALTGATAGSAFGPIGAGVGAVLGGGLQFLSNLSGNNAARVQVDYDNMRAMNAVESANINRQAELNWLQQTNHAENAVRTVARGGKIERKQMDIHEFADKVLKGQHSGARIIKTRCKGGLIVKIKS